MDELDVDAATALAGRGDWIGPDVLETLSEHPLDCIDTEYPHYVHAVEDTGDITPPSDQHPVFYGCFDWHSAVHSHWCLVRQLRLFEDHPRETEIVESIDGRLTEEGIAGELDYFEDNEGFEKPYGWTWLLRLAAELHRWDDPRADEWRETLRPLEDRIATLVESEFLPQERPFRVGTHGNSAFALAGVLDYARVVGADDLAAATCETAERFYADDRHAPVAYEPLGWDFLSPSLTEAALMARVYDRERFGDWFDDFLPAVTDPPHDAVLDPIPVDEGSDGGIELHLVGLNLAKAWCLAELADRLDDHPDADALAESATRHATAGLDGAFTDDYAGSHWLSSFALYLLTRTAGGIAPSRPRS
jgi:hypothetical protein